VSVAIKINSKRVRGKEGGNSPRDEKGEEEIDRGEQGLPYTYFGKPKKTSIGA